MNTSWGYFDRIGKHWYDPNNSGAWVNQFTLPRLDLVRFRVAVTNGIATIDPTTRIPKAEFRADISDYTSSALVLKTDAHFLSDGVFDYANGVGFDTTDMGWHGAADGCFTLAQIAVPLAVASARYNMDVMLFKTGSRWTLRGDSLTMPSMIVERDVYTGSESTPLPGGPGNRVGAVVIAAGQTDSDPIAFTGMTATGVVTCSLLNTAELTTTGATCATDEFTVHIGGTYDVDVTVGYVVEALAI